MCGFHLAWGWLAVTEETGPAATWGQVCIALLIQRASDKAPAVRAKAVANLAALVEQWCSQQTGPMAADFGLFRQVTLRDSMSCQCTCLHSALKTLNLLVHLLHNSQSSPDLLLKLSGCARHCIYEEVYHDTRHLGCDTWVCIAAWVCTSQILTVSKIWLCHLQDWAAPVPFVRSNEQSACILIASACKTS